MARKMVRTSQDKAKRDLKIAEIVYYSIGGVFLALGIIFSIFGVIILNPAQENFENAFLYEAQSNFFSAIKWDTTFAEAGFILMALSIIYFMIVFSIFARKGDDVLKRDQAKKNRQRQVVFTATESNPVETVATEKAE